MLRSALLLAVAATLLSCSGDKPTATGNPPTTSGPVTGSGTPGASTTGTPVGTTPAQAPTLQLLSPQDQGDYPFGTPVLVEIQVTDPDTADLQTLQLEWTGAANTPEAPASTDSSGNAAFYLSDLAAGPHTMTVRVTDADGLSDSANALFTITANDADGDGYTDAAAGGDDCDDGDPAVNPGAAELCDGVDNDCDTLVDINAIDADTWFIDADADGFGDLNDPGVVECTGPVGAVLDNTDCDDAEPTTYPGAPEFCDGIDQDCDTVIDNGVVNSTWYEDADGDGFGDPNSTQLDCVQPPGFVADDTDCDDTAFAVNPNALETCDGIDNDCNTLVDDGVQSTFYGDADGDGYGNPADAQLACTQPGGTVVDNTDCNDGNPAINPGEPEVCNGLDDNCGGGVDEGVQTTYYADADGDGQGNLAAPTDACSPPAGHVENATDCNDGDNAIYLGATEQCNGIDDDCDGVIDNGVGATTYYLDNDGDGFGNPAASTSACVAPPNFVLDSTDCDDTDNAVYPGAPEVCNGVDDDCDLNVDEGVQTLYYQDFDSDGFGNDAAVTQGCAPPVGYVTDNTDCDDTLGTVFPGATETCNGLDDDCDVQVDEGVTSPFWADTDGDSFGDLGAEVQDCSPPAGHVANFDDCDDTDPNVSPAGSEVCNGIDDNCSGIIDDVPGGCAAACPVYADPTVLPGGDGSFANPFPSINYAISFRGVGCDQIVLLPGTYDELVDYAGQDLQISSTGGPAVTTVTSSVAGSIFTFASGETPAAVLSGVTIDGGAAGASNGGGIYIDGASPTITGVEMWNNSAGDGGAIFITGGAPLIEDSLFVTNSATDDGGAIYLVASDAQIRNNTFEGNHATDEGGVLMSISNGNPVIIGNVMQSNTTSSSSGGVWLDDGAPVFANNLLVNNSQTAIYLNDQMTGLIANNTVDGSTYAALRTSSYPTGRVINNLFTNSGTYDVRFWDSLSLSNLTYENNLTWGGPTAYYVSNPTGTDGNITVDPMYVGLGDWSVLWDSRAIDSGQDLTADGITTDQLGNARPLGAAFDRGAYESWGEVPTCPGSTYCATGCPLYVDASVAPGGNGSAASPYPSIAYAMTYGDGCTDILLGPGTYDENTDLGTTDWTITSTGGAAVTNVTSSVGGTIFRIAGGQTPATLIDGLTIGSGDATVGGGLFIDNASPTVSNNVIAGNLASDGAGIYVLGGVPLIDSNTFLNNSASDDGGGIYLVGSDAVIRNNLFDGNHATDEGGVLMSISNGNPVISGNEMWNNTTSSSSGGVWLDDGAPVFTNNLMVGNSQTSIYLNDQMTGLIANNTVSGSTYAALRTSSYPTGRVINNIFANSGTYDVRFWDSLSLSNLTYENNLSWGAPTAYYVSNPTGTDGNITVDPMFVGGTDYTLLWDSRAIDSGQDLTADGLNGDLLGNPRPLGAAFDRGAYETWGEAPICPQSSYCATGCPLYVDAGAVPGGDGSVGNPYPSIAYAMTFGNGCTDIVLGPGTYDENTDLGTADWTITSSGGAAVTTVSSSVGGTIFRIAGGQTPATVISGLTVSGGDETVGGGFYIDTASPTLTGNEITGNTASDGAGVYVLGGAPLIDGNGLSGNSASDDGGGIYLVGSDAVIRNNLFDGNHATDEGGVLMSISNGNPVISGNEMWNNTTSSSSGGVWLDDGAPVFTNNLMVGNSQTSIYLNDQMTGLIANNTVSGSTYAALRTSSYPTGRVINNIFANSGTYDVRFWDSLSLSNLTYENNLSWGAPTAYYVSNPTGTNGNITVDPMFVGGTDYTLLWDSRAIDSGQDLTADGLITDLLGNGRPLGAAYDRGAYETWGESPVCPGSSYCATTCPVYVDAGAVPGGDGAATAPYPSIAYAMTFSDGCTDIVLGPGTYDENVDLGGTDWTITSTAGPALTTVTSSVGGTVFRIAGGQGPATLIDGLTVTGGNETVGGGFYIDTSSPIVSNNVITGNVASDGAGIYLLGGAPLIQGNELSANSASDDGGALYLVASDALVMDNLFDGNHATDEGGVLMSISNGNPVITHNEMWNNTTSSSSGGVWLDDGAPLFANNLMVGNSQTSIYLNDQMTGLIANNTVVDSTYAALRTSSYPTGSVINNLFINSGTYDVRFWDSLSLSNLTYEDNDAWGAPTTYYVSNPTGTNGNISNDPMFVGLGDYSLLWGSACIDSGQDLGLSGVSDDLNHTARPQGLGYDMGAIESW